LFACLLACLQSRAEESRARKLNYHLNRKYLLILALIFSLLDSLCLLPNIGFNSPGLLINNNFFQTWNDYFYAVFLLRTKVINSIKIKNLNITGF